MKGKTYLIFSYAFILIIPLSAIVSYFYPVGSPFKLLQYP